VNDFRNELADNQGAYACRIRMTGDPAAEVP
jgi:hypothetical protein